MIGLLVALAAAAGFVIWRWSFATLLAGTLGAAGLLLAFLLLALCIPLSVRVAVKLDGAPDRNVEVSARYLLGALTFNFRQPLPGEGDLRLRLLGYDLLEALK